MTDPISTAWEGQRAAMGAFIRSQRELANLSLRELSRATQVSNAYLSQIERGKNDPTLRVLLQIGDALELTVGDILERGAGRQVRDEQPVGVEQAIRADRVLTPAEKEALVAVYTSYARAHEEKTRQDAIRATARAERSGRSEPVAD